MTAPAWLMRPLVLRELRLASTTGPAEGARFSAPRDAASRTVFANRVTCEHYPNKDRGAQKRPKRR